MSDFCSAVVHVQAHLQGPAGGCNGKRRRWRCSAWGQCSNALEALFVCHGGEGVFKFRWPGGGGDLGAEGFFCANLEGSKFTGLRGGILGQTGAFAYLWDSYRARGKLSAAI